MWRIRQYLSFLLKSTNAHGVHSPFVYDLVTKCFYNKDTQQQPLFLKSKQLALDNKKEKLLIKIINYFQFSEILNISSVKTNTSTNSHQSLENVLLTNKENNAVIISEFNSIQPFLTNNTVVIVDNIYQSKKQLENWNTLKNQSKVSISIDTFYFGLLFFRTENKHPEHFTIRV